MNWFRTFIKNKMVAGGIFMVIFYQIIFIGLFMYGYSAVPKNVTNLDVAIVNEDEGYGKEMAQQLQSQLPFKIDAGMTLDEAQVKLDDRDIQMIVHIPKDFSEKMNEQGEQAKLDFFLNASNPAMVTSSMQSVVTQITTQINSQFTSQGIQGALQGVNVPEDQAKQTAEAIQSKLATNIVTTNPLPAGMHNQMAPMFLSMVSYVGAMIFSMMLVGVTNGLKDKIGRGKAFLAYQIVSAMTALVAPLIGLGIYFSIQGGYDVETFLRMWMLHSLEMLTAIEFTALPVLLFGQGGMIVNLPLLLAQTISGGVVMTRDMMPGFFKPYSYVSTLFYSSQSDFSILFGGGKLTEYVIGLACIGVFSLLFGILIYQLKSMRATAKAAKEAKAATEPAGASV